MRKKKVTNTLMGILTIYMLVHVITDIIVTILLFVHWSDFEVFYRWLDELVSIDVFGAFMILLFVIYAFNNAWKSRRKR